MKSFVGKKKKLKNYKNKTVKCWRTNRLKCGKSRV